jgi:DnaJ domain
LGSNPYAVLGIARGATDTQIAQARHWLVRKYHPDVNHDPDARARFEDVQRAFELLSDPAARAEYDRTHDEQGRELLTRAADGGYGLDEEAAAGVFLVPSSVDFGVLTPQRPWADAKVAIAWTGTAPESVTRDTGGEWWRVMDSERVGSSLVYRLRAAAHSGGPKGQQRAQFTVTVNGTGLTAGLTADFQGDFSAVAKPNYDPPAAFHFHVPEWLAVFHVPERLAVAVNKHVALLIAAFLGLFGIACMAGAGMMAYRADGDRAQAGQFLAAPLCAGNATPAGDCSAWQTRTVSNVLIRKGTVNIDLDGDALHLWYTSVPGWVGGLTVGESVPVLVWEGSAQALRDPQGHLFYGKHSALYQEDYDIGVTVCLCGLALLFMGGAFAASPWFRRRSPRYVLLAILHADVGASGTVSGFVILGTNSVGTGVTIGVILFCVSGLVAAVVMRRRRARTLAAHG